MSHRVPFASFSALVLACAACAPTPNDPPIEGGGSKDAAASDSGAVTDAGGGGTDAGAGADAGGGTDAAAASHLACAATNTITMDTSLDTQWYGRMYVASMPATGSLGAAVFTAVSHLASDKVWHTALYVFDPKLPNKVTKVSDDPVRIIDLRVFDTTFVMLALDPTGIAHTLTYDYSKMGQVTFKPADVPFSGKIGACDLISGSLYVADKKGDFVAAIGGTACGATYPWLGVVRTGKAMTTLNYHPEMQVQSTMYPMDAMILGSQSIFSPSAGKLWITSVPDYKNAAVPAGMTGMVYEVDAATLAQGNTIKMLVGNPQMGALSPVAVADGPNLLVQTIAGGPGNFPVANVGNGAAATKVLSGLGIAEQTLVTTQFKAVDEAMMWDVTAQWFGSEVLVSSVALGQGASGANVHWWNKDGLLRGSAFGAASLGKPKVHYGVGSAFDSHANPGAHLWVSGTYPSGSQVQGPATVVMYDVSCK